MQRVLLKFESLQQIAGTEEVAVILLTDEARSRVLSVVCDAEMTHQLLLRLRGKRAVTRTMLPEALLHLMHSTYEMLIVGIYDGQYQVMLMDTEKGTSVRVRMSDAVLLSLISNIPLYIEAQLWEKQNAPYDENAPGVAIPINTMDMSRLKAALQNAVDEENYELASHLRDEINSRSQTPAHLP